MTVANDLAKFVTQTSYKEIPAKAIDHAAMLIASTISSAALGSQISSSQIVKSLVCEQGGTPEASIWFDTGPKVPVANAARVNALMSDAAASDDSDLRNIVHPGTNLVATSLAMAEKTRSCGSRHTAREGIRRIASSETSSPERSALRRHCRVVCSYQLPGATSS